MQLNTFTSLLTLTITLAWQAGAQIYDTNNVVIQTFAGSGFSGYVDGQGAECMFSYPSYIVSDSMGNLFVADGFKIRKITQTGTVSTFASPPTGGAYVGPLAIDHDNNVWAAINNASEIAQITTNGQVQLVEVSWSADAQKGFCVDSMNNLYYSGGNIIYRLTNGVVEVFAGSGNAGAADGNWIFTSFNNPTALAADAADNIYVWDSGNHAIRRINQNRDVVTITANNSNGPNVDGQPPSFNSVYAICIDTSGNLVLACGSSVRKMSVTTNGVTLAGSFTQGGFTNGAGSLARFAGASGVCVSQGTIFVADCPNYRIRQLTFNPSAQPVLPPDLLLSMYPGLQIIGTVGRTYRIESSPDLNTWSTTATLLLTASPYLWIDHNPAGGNKFYRAFLLP